ncbi:MAG TPA: L-threonylcarbamoyladenylate synthase [Opitutaceae bacterium]|nr:L-threonylcarbamoyladenylate synthase [Opitutaceae bacterium]
MTQRPRARLYHGTPRTLAYLAGQLRAGELVAVPTETVYGLAANALDPAACRKIFTAKGRPVSDPLIVHIHSLEQLTEIGKPNKAALDLARAFWPGPLTLVLPKKNNVPDIVTAGRPSVAVRMPSHPLLRRLLKKAGIPLAAPSANLFGYVSPTTAAHVQDGLGKKISHILDGGPARIGLESTIVDVRSAQRIRLLRPGAVTKAQLERVLGQPVNAITPRVAAPKATTGQLAPGSLARHYSPRTPVSLHGTLPAGRKTAEAYVFLRKPGIARAMNVFWLDARGDLRGVARRLFATLRRLDAMGFSRIHIERPTGEGLADAINDRLRRAAAR